MTQNPYFFSRLHGEDGFLTFSILTSKPKGLLLWEGQVSLNSGFFCMHAYLFPISILSTFF